MRDPVESLREEIPVPAFHPAAIPVVVDEDTLHVRSGPFNGVVYTVHDAEREGLVGRLAELIDGETPVEEVVEAFGEDNRAEICKTLEGLQSANAIHDASSLEDPLHPHLAMRASFQYWDRQSLDEKSVVIVNAGRMGPQVATDLVEMGVGEVGLLQPVENAAMDPGPVADSEAFSAFDADDLGPAVEAADFAVYTADRPYPPLVSEVNELAHGADTPWVPAQTMGFDGIVGPAVFPGETACYECFESRVAANVNDVEGYRSYRSTLAEDYERTPETLPTLSRAIAGFLTNDLLNLLSFGVGYTAETVVTMNSIDMTVEKNRVLKMPRCEVCGADTARDYTRFVDYEDLLEVTRIREGR